MIGRTLMHPIARTVWGLLLVLILYLAAQSIAGVGALGALAGLVIVGSVVERRRPERYGLNWRAAPRGLPAGLLLGAAVISISIGFLALIGDYRARYRLDVAALGAGVLFYLQVAIGEEVMFRGIALRVLEELGNKYVALALSSLLFLFFHTLRPQSDPAFAAVILAAGFAFGAAYLATRALWLPIAMHWAFDSLAGPVFGTRPWSENGAYVLHSTVVASSEYAICAGLFALTAAVLLVRGRRPHGEGP
jgi:hypothetical protein